MSSINFSSFMGEMPVVNAKKLPPGYATEALNCVLSTGSLEAQKGLGSPIHTFSESANETLSRYPYGGSWQVFSLDVDLLRGPIANDAWQRVYWTDGVYPKYSTSDNALSGSYRLGIPAPTSAPTAVGPSGEPPDGGIELECAYIVTYVSKYGEEGPPSDASAIVTRWDSGEVQLSGLPVQPSGEYNIEKIRIYRSESGGIFNFVTDLIIGTTSYADSIKTKELLGECPSYDWLAPKDELTGLCYLGNGVLAGFTGNTLCFCEPYQPHAWPPGYQLAFPYEIVGIGFGSGGLVVTTESDPWLVTGSHPSGMFKQKLDNPLACINKRSMVDMGEYVIYASTDGLVAAASGEAKLITSKFISKSDYEALNPQSWKCYRFDDRYFILADTQCLSFSPNEGFRHFSVVADAAYYDRKSGELFLLQNDRTVREWGGGLNMLAVWTSGIITLPPRMNLAIARVDCDGSCDLKVRMDGIEVFSKAVSSEEQFRLPARRFRELQISLETTGVVHSVSLAQTSEELK